MMEKGRVLKPAITPGLYFLGIRKPLRDLKVFQLTSQRPVLEQLPPVHLNIPSFCCIFSPTISDPNGECFQKARQLFTSPFKWRYCGSSLPLRTSCKWLCLQQSSPCVSVCSTSLGGGWGKWDSNTSPTGVLIDSPGLERKKKNRKAFVSCCQAVAWLKSICGVTGLFYSQARSLNVTWM